MGGKDDTVEKNKVTKNTNEAKRRSVFNQLPTERGRKEMKSRRVSKISGQGQRYDRKKGQDKGRGKENEHIREEGKFISFSDFGVRRNDGEEDKREKYLGISKDTTRRAKSSERI